MPYELPYTPNAQFNLDLTKYKYFYVEGEGYSDVFVKEGKNILFVCKLESGISQRVLIPKNLSGRIIKITIVAIGKGKVNLIRFQ